MAVLFVRRFLQDNIIAYVLLGLALLFLPNIWGVGKHVYMYPYFVAGYIFSKFKTNEFFSLLNVQKLLVLCCGVTLLYIILLSHFSTDDYVYTTGTCVLAFHPSVSIQTKQICTDTYRYFIGFVGSSNVLLIIYILYRHADKRVFKYIGDIGKKSIGIYVLSVAFVNRWLIMQLPHKECYGYGSVLVESLVVIAITYCFTILLEKNTLTKKMLLGSR